MIERSARLPCPLSTLGVALHGSLGEPIGLALGRGSPINTGVATAEAVDHLAVGRESTLSPLYRHCCPRYPRAGEARMRQRTTQLGCAAAVGRSALSGAPYVLWSGRSPRSHCCHQCCKITTVDPDYDRMLTTIGKLLCRKDYYCYILTTAGWDGCLSDCAATTQLCTDNSCCPSYSDAINHVVYMAVIILLCRI